MMLHSERSGFVFMVSSTNDGACRSNSACRVLIPIDSGPAAAVAPEISPAM